MKVLPKIEELLRNKSYLRDCDKKLTTHIWYRQLQDHKIDPHNLTTTDFLRLYADGKISSDATVIRLRAKLQEQYPELRGQNYLDRQIRKQQKVKEDLGYGDSNRK
jgi:hypothetical protein